MFECLGCIIKMAGSSSKRARKRSPSPCDLCVSHDPVRVALEDQIQTLENTLRDRERCVATLRRERDEAVTSRNIKDRDLDIVREDYRRAQRSHTRAVHNWFALTFDINDNFQPHHPRFSVWSATNWKPGSVSQLQGILQGNYLHV